MGARCRSESKAKPLSSSFKITLRNPDLWMKLFCQSYIQPELAKDKQQEEIPVLLLTEVTGNLSSGTVCSLYPLSLTMPLPNPSSVSFNSVQTWKMPEAGCVPGLDLPSS